MVSPVTPTRDRRAPEERRAQLLDATIAAIAAHGFDGVTVRDVAQHAGVSPGLLHHYFSSLDELVSTAFARSAQAEIDRLTAEAAALPSPRERLDRLVARYAPVAGDPGWLLWLSAWGAAPRQPTLRATAERLHLAWAEQFTRVLADGASDGVFRCADPERAGRRLVSLLDGLATQVVALGLLTPADIADDVGASVAAETGLRAADFPMIAALAAPAATPRQERRGSA